LNRASASAKDRNWVARGTRPISTIGAGFADGILQSIRHRK
jgi:hypothetical protein